MTERPIDKFLQKKIKIGAVTLTALDLCFIIAVAALALAARLELFPLISGDYKGFLSKWMAKIQQYGAFNSLGIAISNYSSSYMYLMSLVSGFSNPLHSLKAVSVVFDYLAAFATFLIIWQLTKDSRKSIFGMAAVLLCPTVMINSAWWCQCDVIYCSFMLFAVLFLLKDKSALSCIFLGIAFSFKLQALLILPLFIIMWLKNRTVKVWHLLYIPLVFFVLQIPAWIAGRPLGDLLGIYFTQAGTYPWGTLKYPNIYEFLDETYKHRHFYKELGGWGMFFSIGVTGLLTYYMCIKKFKMTDTIIITLAIFSVAVILFTLPHMHERYGFIIDLLAIIYAVQRPRKTPVAVLLITISMLTYMPFLNGAYVFSFAVLSAVMMGLIMYIGYDLYTQINQNALK